MTRDLQQHSPSNSFSLPTIMMSWARESRSATRAAMYVSGVIDEKEWAGIHSSWPHDFQRSLRKFSSPSLFPSILSVAPDCIAQIFNSSSSNWHRCCWGSMRLNYWSLFGGPTVPVEKLHIADTRRISVAWTSTAELFCPIPHIWRPPWRRCKR